MLVKDVCVTPKRVGVLFKGKGLFPRVILGCLLLSLLSEVNRVIENFYAEEDILLF